MDGNKKPQLIELMDVSGGVNTAEHPLRIGERQVQPETIGCMLKKSGILKYPGVTGAFPIVSSQGYTLKGFWKGEDNLLDSSGNGYDGADVGGTVGYSDGFVGRCFLPNDSLNGVRVPHVFQFGATSQFYVDFYYESSGSSGATLGQGIAGETSEYWAVKLYNQQLETPRIELVAGDSTLVKTYAPNGSVVRYKVEYLAGGWNLYFYIDSAWVLQTPTSTSGAATYTLDITDEELRWGFEGYGKFDEIQLYSYESSVSFNSPFSSYLRLLDIYRDFAGDENLIALSNGILSTIDPSAGTKVDRYTLGGASNEGWKTEAYGKAWICNGSAVVKMEFDRKVYPVGIAAPAGSTIQVVSETDNPLPKGTYSVIVTYARRIPSTGKVLYSKGEYAEAGGGSQGQITIEYDEQTVEVTIPASSDLQVNDKIVWLKRPNDAVHYYFTALGEVEQTIKLTSLMSIDATKVYESTAIYNAQPPQGATFIHAFADRIWLVKGNVIYYSNKGKFNDLDLEVFEPANFVSTAYNLTGIFSDGQNLCFNTTEGILLMPNADPNAILYLTEPRWHFTHMRTVARWNNGVIGVTNDGVKTFADGKFSDYDLSYTIKSKIAKLYQSSGNFKPCGYVYRRSFRNEYHLMWQDPTLGTTINNVHAILNLDTMYWASPNDNNLPWEFQPYSGNYAVVSKESNTVYVGQSHATAPAVYRESASDQSIGVYKRDGTLLTVETSHEMTLRTRIMMLSSNVVCWLKRVYLLAQFTKAYTVRIVVTDRRGRIATDTPVSVPVGVPGDAVYGTAVFDQDVYPYTDVDVYILKLPDALRGKAFYVEITQTDNDPDFQLMSAMLLLDAETGNFT